MTASPAVPVPVSPPPAAVRDPDRRYHRRVGTWHRRDRSAPCGSRRPGPSEQARLELVQDENAAAYLEVVAGAASRLLARGSVPRLRARSMRRLDAARSRFYLERALRLAPPESALASEIHYQLACRFRRVARFSPRHARTGGGLRASVQDARRKAGRRYRGGGKLYELASTAPFDKAVNDLLLNMSIGIG